ncbi:hypothetical protein [Streptomyces sp. NBC_01264]|uniref:hypothetical protein n=1 Tax=Streptomyces sp. NBC_01264 TaxID=2903804 RepID=UPI0022530280|nr:hypothetical protein [Streptomyces sp. NBC_01264]MCX4781112.1 hypothetical protein [Streptomyces sp. NBC_01264]
MPFVWNGAQWTTPAGEWRDWPLIRRDMGGWLRSLVEGVEADASNKERQRALRESLDEARNRAEDAQSDEEQEHHYAEVGRLRQELDSLPAPAEVAPSVVRDIATVASEVESASDARATQLLSLASQFDAFRAPLNDPAAWVRMLGTAPHSAHVRTSVVWEAFCAAEPVLARNMGTTAGKRALFTAMDKRFGARRKLAGYEGWRGAVAPEADPRG